MIPYYSDDYATLYHADCADVLPAVPEVDLLLTDPPYGIEYVSGQRPGESAMAGDGIADRERIRTALGLALRCLREKRHVYIFGPVDLAGLPLSAITSLVWDKQNGGMGDLSLPWSISHEPITFAVRVTRPANRAEGRGSLAARLRKNSVLRVPRTNAAGSKRHPTEKPVPLLRDLIESSSMLGETVLDPFAGVGSTLVAAKLEGRKAIGIEIDERYCAVAAARLASIHEQVA